MEIEITLRAEKEMPSTRLMRVQLNDFYWGVLFYDTWAVVTNNSKVVSEFDSDGINLLSDKVFKLWKMNGEGSIFSCQANRVIIEYDECISMSSDCYGVRQGDKWSVFSLEDEKLHPIGFKGNFPPVK